MVRYLNIIESLIDNDAKKFASSYNCPHINQWIIDNFNKGHTSPKDYDKIVRWVIDTSPSISRFDFNSALNKSTEYLKSRMNNNFNKYDELNSNNIIINFDDGKKWIEIGPDDLNSAINKMQYDCHDDLQTVMDGEGDCWILLDAQDNAHCLLVNDNNGCKVIGVYGNRPDCYKEIKSICIRKGIDLIPEAYSYAGLINALKSGQLNINNVNDKRELFKRLNSDDIINCGLINQCQNATVGKIYELYKKTNHDCLILYCFAYLMSHNFIDTEVYNIIKSECINDDNLMVAIKKYQSNDSHSYIKMMDDYSSIISGL